MKPRALFVHNTLTTFVRLDRDLLADDYALTEVHYRWRAASVRQWLPTLAQSEVVFAWFASHHSFLPAVLGRMLGKRVVIFAADYDLAAEHAYGYGAMRGGVRRLVGSAIFRAADTVIVPSAYSAELARRNTPVRPERLHVIPLGLPSVPAPTQPKTRLAMTVASISGESIWRKGLTTFARMGHHLPDIPCYLVGKGAPHLLNTLNSLKSENVTLTGFMPDAALYDLMGRAGVYAQLSYMEGFGLAVAEAMLHECVPVVTARGSLPEVVGETGVYVPYDDPAASAAGVREALNRPELGAAARQRVLDLFTLEGRRAALRDVLRGLS